MMCFNIQITDVECFLYFRIIYTAEIIYEVTFCQCIPYSFFLFFWLLLYQSLLNLSFS